MRYNQIFGEQDSIQTNVLAKPLVIGCILGDGYVNKHTTLTIEHLINQRPDVFWK